MEPLLAIRDLHTEFRTGTGIVRAVDGVSWDVGPGETVAIVGESGSGKSVTALSVLRLIADPPGRITGGEIWFGGRDLLQLPPEAMREIRGGAIGMVFQEPMTSLNPVLTIGRQITETLEQHRGMERAAAYQRAVELLVMVGIADAARRLKQYPHQLSGGMRQRVMIAIALACEPKLIIADEPTTALDVTIQAQILELMKTSDTTAGCGAGDHHPQPWRCGALRKPGERDVCRAYRGKRAGGGHLSPAAASLHDGAAAVCASAGPAAPGAAGPGGRAAARFDAAGRRMRLPSALPVRDRCVRQCASATAGGRGGRAFVGLLPQRGTGDREGRGMSPQSAPPLLDVRGLRMHFAVTEGIVARRKVGEVKAVDGIDFTMQRGETLGLVGESGCGKTTTGRCILRLERPTEGAIIYDGTDIATLEQRDLRAWRRRIQVVFQDPYSSLNPRMKVGEIIGEPMKVHGIVPNTAKRTARVRELLHVCGLNPRFADRYPHEMSGGQRQRVGIARALALEPEFIVCDEAVSALDVSIQAQVINLLEDLREQFDLTYLFIAHDLSVVRHICHRVAVMYLGRIVELADADELFGNPLHPYTQALLAAVPVPDPTVETARNFRPVQGEVPSPINPPSGCVFHPRCPIAVAGCREARPVMRELRPDHYVACSEAG